jgi:hypothetical protein
VKRNLVVFGLAATVMLAAMPALGCAATAASAGQDGWSAARVMPTAKGFEGFDDSCVTPAKCFVFEAVNNGNPFLPENFTVSVVRGAWGKPSLIPKSVQVGHPAYACAAPGECIVSGWFRHAEAAVRVNGAWGKAREIPGVAALGANSRITTFTCSGTGWCSAAGSYQLPGKSRPAKFGSFVVSERAGTWRDAEPITGLAAIDKGGQGGIGDMSCIPQGQCTGVGFYTTPSGQSGLLSVAENGGTWGSARVITGALPAVARSLFGMLRASCTAPGNCSVVGTYNTALHQDPDQVFTVTETGGRWGRVQALPGLAALRARFGNGMITGVSCSGPGECVLAGSYASAGAFKYSAEPSAVFVASQVNGTWQRAHGVSGPAGIRPGQHAGITSVSCGQAGGCVAAGGYPVSGGQRAFVVTEKAGHWGRAIEVPGLAGLTSDNSTILWTDCWSAARCIAVGTYHPGIDTARSHLFVTTRT